MNSMIGEQSICFEKPAIILRVPLWQVKKKENQRTYPAAIYHA